MVPPMNINVVSNRDHTHENDGGFAFPEAIVTKVGVTRPRSNSEQRSSSPNKTSGSGTLVSYVPSSQQDSQNASMPDMGGNAE